MKVFFLFLILLSILMQESQVQEAQPKITVDVGPAKPNEVVVIRVTVENPGTADTLWKNVLRIADVHPNFVPVKIECPLSEKIRPGQVDIGDVTVQVKREAEAGTYPVLITLSGGVGPCEEGCVPYLIEEEVVITVVRDEPELEITHTVQGDQIVVTLKNIGGSRAQNVLCNGEIVDKIPPGSQKEIIIREKSTFTVTYEDEYGKSFTKSYNISEGSADKEDKETSIQSALVGVGLFIGYLLKRCKP